MAHAHGIGIARGSHRAAGVETEPTHPEAEDTQGTESQVVAGNGSALAVLVVFADAGTQHNGTCQGQGTTTEVYHGTSGKVMEAHLGEPASAP